MIGSQVLCKICGFEDLKFFKHTARCKKCKVLLYYPYPEDDLVRFKKEGSASHIDGKGMTIDQWKEWYIKSGSLNHFNFTEAVKFSIGKKITDSKPIKLLDYGGGGGQFALVAKSLIPNSTTYIVDINDSALLPWYASLNNQIKFLDFEQDSTTFDYIFLNDVFEHLTDPVGCLKMLQSKLAKNGKIFIDTPRQFWMYPFFNLFYKKLYTKLLIGTVSTAHLQIWSKKSLFFAINAAELRVEKFKISSEFTMPWNFYLDQMGITNPLLRIGGMLFYKNARWLANNKYFVTLSK